MNSSFNAYQLVNEPEIGNIRKHIRLKKSMSLPDDTLEYWGFFLPKGSQMKLRVCSKSNGARILVVKGNKNLDTCGLLDHSKNKGINPTRVPFGSDQVRVVFETVAQEVNINDTDVYSYEKRNDIPYSRQTRSVNFERNDVDSNDAGEVENTDGMKAFMFFKELARNHMNKYHDEAVSPKLRTVEEHLIGHKLRHAKQKSIFKKAKTFTLSNSNIEDRIKEDQEIRRKRHIVSKVPHNLDIDKVAHGGNALNFTDDESSTSSFETSLLSCYDGKILLNHVVPSSDMCLNTSFLLSSGAMRMSTTHNVSLDGYYYYIFYSDNDDVQNDIHATFDIFKPTFEYSNFTMNCMNTTECIFPLNFFTNQRVIVEIPTKNGIEHEDDDISFLLSVCEPRMSVYIVFPILVLFLILGCAFL